MSLRDLLVIAIVLWASISALRKPWIGILCWTWLSVMNPHRYAWGIAFDAPLAAIVAGTTLLGTLITQDKRSPFQGAPVAIFFAFTVWMTISWANSLDPQGDMPQWEKVLKINLMTMVGLAVIRQRLQIMALAWVATFSLALLGAKGGIFTIMSGGGARVWGPPGSFIEDNNEFALALVTTIPMLRFLQMQVQDRRVVYALTGIMMLCAASVLGSQSRGGLLAIATMALVLWWRGKRKALAGILIAGVAIWLLTFMPDEWSARMATIGNYQEDGSAMGRISAWWNAWNLAFEYPTGAGFTTARPDLFARYSPYPTIVQGAHSIYFQALGSHGFIGLGLFLLIGLTTWLSAGWLRKHAARTPEAKWAGELGGMVQVSMAGYAVGGAFLGLAYFDLPYILMTLVVLSRAWVVNRDWERESLMQPRPRWYQLFGLVPRAD